MGFFPLDIFILLCYNIYIIKKEKENNKMYVCPTCSKEFKTEDGVRKHMLKCWKEIHPYHKSKDAPRSENIITREVSNDIMDFFNSLEK